jgi:hypothetical protein
MARLVPTLALLLLVAAAGAGCPSTSGGNPDAGDAGGPACTTRGDCPEGLACSAEGHCAPCESSGQCLLREVCNPDTLACELKADWGTACARNEECQAGQWCRQGLCKDRDEVRLCPGGASRECAPGERCNAVNLVCEEDLGCAEEADCGAEETCNPGTRRCVPRCTGATQAEVCAAGERCHEERCVQCVAATDCGPQQTCDAAGRCVESPRCDSDRDCQVPLVCHRPTGACLGSPPACTSDESCAEEERCDLGSGRCVPRGCQRDLFEDNDTPEKATAVAASLYEGLTLCSGDLDYFAVTLARGDRLGVSLEADPFSEATFTTLVQDAGRRTLASGRLSASYVAPAAGTYYVMVASTDASQPYDIAFLLSRGIPCDDDGWEPNDTPETATALNATRTADGRVCPQDTDHFTVSVSGGGAVHVRLAEYTAALGLLELCVLQGSAAPQCTQAEVPELAVQVAGGASALVVRVRGAGEQTANTYTLQVEVP